MFYLKNIKLSNFRCYKSVNKSFSPHINIIIGDNAVGKTSLVEAIYALGTTKSHKSSKDSELIKHGESFCFVKGEFLDDRKSEIVFSLSEKGKQIVKDGKKIKHLSEYFGYFYTVLFCPEDLDIIKGSPMERRRFLDINIGQIKPQYLKNVIDYKKILKERNTILKQISENQKYDQNLLNLYTNQLVKLGKEIVVARKEFIDKINTYFRRQTDSISGGFEITKIVYNPNCDVENMEITFKEKEKLDLVTKTTNCGPHRDDFSIYYNDIESIYASQGQQKTFVLALKLALIDVIKEKSNRIIVILDDVFGELDIRRQKELIKLLNIEYQTFITTTSINHLDNEVLNNSNIIEINKESE